MPDKLLQSNAKGRKTFRPKAARAAELGDVLRVHHDDVNVLAREARDREGYLKQPEQDDEIRPWKDHCYWPSE